MTTWLLDGQKRLPSDFRPSTGPEATWSEVAASAFREQNLNYAIFGMQWEILDRIERARRDAGIDSSHGFTRSEITEIMTAVSKGTDFDERPYDVEATDTTRAFEDRGIGRIRRSDRNKSVAERVREFEKATGSNMRDLVKGVYTEAQKRDETARDVAGRSGLFKSLVGGIGGTGAAMLDAERDPTNFFTLGIGGIGRTILARVGTEGLAQSGIEGLNFALGAKRNRDLAGLETTGGQIAAQIALTGAAGATFRGALEGAGAFKRKLFGRPPEKPPVPRQPASEAGPPPSPDTAPAPTRIAEPEGVLAFDFNEGRGIGIDNVPRALDETKIDSTGGTVTARAKEAEYFAVEYREMTSRMYTERAGTPVDISAPVRVDYNWRVRAVDEAEPFRGDTSPAEALMEIEIPTPDGTVVRPFRAIAGEPIDEMAIADAVNDANPTLVRLRASLTEKIGRIESMIADKQDAAGIKEAGELEGQINELKSEIARGAYPKKRVRDLVRQDIADLEARKAALDARLKDVDPEVKYLKERLGELRAQQGMVDSEFAHLTREAVGTANESVPTPLPVDPLFGRTFLPTSADVVKMSADMDKVIADIEKTADDAMENMLTAAKAAAEAEDRVRIDIGDLKNVDLDQEFVVDVSDDGTVHKMTVREFLKETGNDDNLLSAMQSCSVKFGA